MTGTSSDSPNVESLSAVTTGRAARRRSVGSRLLSGGLWMVFGRGIQALCGMLVTALLARMLAPEDMATYFILASIALLGSTLAQFGTHHSIVRLVAAGMAIGDEAGVRRSLRGILVIAALGALVVSGGYVLGGGSLLAEHVFGSGQVAAFAGLTALWIVAREGQMLLSKAFRGFHDFARAAVYEGAQTQFFTALLLGGLWLAVGQVSLQTALGIGLAAFGLTLLTGGWLLWRDHWSRLAPARGLALGPVLRLSAPLFVSSFSILALGETHLWLLGALAGADQVAIYGAAYRLMQLVALPISLVNHVIPPMIAELHAQGKRGELERMLRSTATLAAVPALALLSLVILFSGEVLRILYGEYFAAGAWVLVIMAAGQAVNVLTGSPGNVLAMCDQQGLLMRAAVGGGLVGVVMSLALVQTHGAAGVALGYASGLALQNLLMALFARRVLGITTFAGVGYIRDSWFWLRGELVRRAHRVPLFYRLERLLRPLEDLACALLRVRVVECMGDSHCNIFPVVNRTGCMPGVYFRATVVQGATAYGLANLNSRTGAARIFGEWLSRMPRHRPLLFLLGEVDVGYRAWKKAEQAGVTAREVIEESLLRYFEFMELCQARGHRVALVTIPLPSVRDSDAAAMDVQRPGLSASQWERTRLSLEFNAALRRWAADHDAYLVDLDEALLDPDTGTLRKEYYKGKRGGNRLEPQAFARLICRILSGQGFMRWLDGAARKAGGENDAAE
ncbi:lipopolysaccharide biosynthesis protein [Thiohalobacter sp. IOR34]|uniref:lipopolysaccharide biosynthesis protein n=1 Tax=Thiohalobacter sp. IOR34 TaxID=3057176 RepID=UPI0025B054E4|nr:lipopolysaccharide biosynthesis protein [Thiohalobacter sp. IOR34]WJW75307.1 lipopolysaccharide biosynthesis protein [Thiohalobacter sp. IOR34]